MLRQSPTSPVVRLHMRAQTDRMGRRIASIQSGATSVMGPALRQEIYTKLKSMKWRNKNNLSGTASFEECIDAAITHHLEPAVEDYVNKIVTQSNQGGSAFDPRSGSINCWGLSISSLYRRFIVAFFGPQIDELSSIYRRCIDDISAKCDIFIYLVHAPVCTVKGCRDTCLKGSY